MEGGRIVEDGTPADLAGQPQSRYSALLEAEVVVRQGLWSHGRWRRLWLNEGRLVEDHAVPEGQCSLATKRAVSRREGRVITWSARRISTAARGESS